MAIVIRTAKFFHRISMPKGRAVKALNLLKNFQKEYDSGKPVSYKTWNAVIENPDCREIGLSCWKVCPRMGATTQFRAWTSYSCTWRVGECKDCPSRNYDNAAYIWRTAAQEEE